MGTRQFIAAVFMLSIGSCLLPAPPWSGARANAPTQTRSSELPPSAAAPNKNHQDYVGDQACLSCHQEKTETYFRSAHHLTSRPPTRDSISGSFTEGQNILKTANSALTFHMEARPAGFYQSAIWNIPPVTSEHTQRMDIVIGSGRKGQTYLYWKGDRLFQLPISYWVALNSWVNSPGYRDGTADFDRPVIPRCLECHGTYLESIGATPPPNRYNRSSLVEGIACERCHGPGREHAAPMQQGKTQGAIINPAKLSRDRQIDICAQCHAGHGQSLTPAFSYRPGQPLDQYLQRDVPAAGATVDVHGNQIALLQMSRCFQSSANMTCSTCHNVHQPQRDAAAFSERCLTCHKLESCGLHAKMGAEIAGKCVDCHMPNQESNLIVSASNGTAVKAIVRTHWIRIYPQAPHLEAH